MEEQQHPRKTAGHQDGIDKLKLDYERLAFENRERLKELAAINRTTAILKEGRPLDETLQQVCMILPPAWQYPEYTAARIRYGQYHYKTSNFLETKWVQRQSFETIDGTKGSVEVCYLTEFVQLDEGPFMKEERHLINNIAEMVTGYINSLRACALLPGESTREKPQARDKAGTTYDIPNRQLLRRFLNKNNYDRDIYHDLMLFKVKEILLIANLYDAYSIEKEGRFSEYVLGEYQTLNLTSVPRITGVSSLEEAMTEIQTRHFDLIIIMMGQDKVTPVEIANTIKEAYPYIQIFLLLNNNQDVRMVKEKPQRYRSIDKTFVWNGDSRIFFAMIKYVEDKINVDNDTRFGLVRVLLLVEDSPVFYSRYLPMLYNIVLEQTKRIIEDVSTDELYKILRLRARPKILLASNYEEAVQIADRYRDYLLCLVTDMRFEKDDRLNEQAGAELVAWIRAGIRDLPVIVQSSERENAQKAYELRASFIDKNSETLSQDFRSFITHYLGFGNFIYRDREGNQIAVAKSLREFETHLKTIPDDSLIYHAKKDHFSLWLMARGEIQAAKILNPEKVTDFDSPAAVRQHLIEVIQTFRNEQNKGKVIPFEESAISDESNILSLSPGSMGGKGRGLAFVNTLIYNFDFSHLVPDINIRAPKTSIIGTDEFEYFMERNKLADQVLNEPDYEVIKRLFVAGRLTDGLIRKLKSILKEITNPLAVRSSGLFEDSLMQPFAGIFETYILPNNHPDINVRLNHLMDAIKLVYASIYSKVARGYIEAIHYSLEEEKMAVVLQEVVGNRYGDYYYPHISGVAQSYNYYPFAHMKPGEGFAVVALGLGKYVVEGEKAYRFSPLYPTLDINSPRDQYKNSQVDFIAVDLKRHDIDLLEGDMAGLTQLDIYEAEKHGTIKHCASVYDAESNRIVPGITQPGPRIINFANILKYNYIPLAKTIEVVLDIVKEAMGCPVEIEFAVDLNKDASYKSSFYLLQIKPLLGNAQDYNIDLNEIRREDMLLFSEKGMGNGVIEGVSDVIYVDPVMFDKSRTLEMAEEIEVLNAKMGKAGKQYVLIGPGRWGTRDRWIGIPVAWPQISNAKVIVETSLEAFPLDASSGSHFFHNVTSMNVGYFSVLQELKSNFIAWEVLAQQPLVEASRHFRHVRFDRPLTIRMDGKKRISVITFK
ncbi:MAG TPA: PEP/pyruvate-binding domain-containing protein [Bacteroidales bacterium]|nr:PEP/pyruvate-binding domain-containing protein [Bacteroidales bacterium]HSA44672.1 PEP/pyruvate-binding domain-containing protein [Bacteroidales bacterium]